MYTCSKGLQRKYVCMTLCTYTSPMYIYNKETICVYVYPFLYMDVCSLLWILCAMKKTFYNSSTAWDGMIEYYVVWLRIFKEWKVRYKVKIKKRK